MGSMARPVLCAFVTVLVLATAVQAAFDGYDGMPRPDGMDESPTHTYGAKPAVTYLNKPANCIWYGWENGNYPPEGTKNCSTLLWASLSNANPAELQGFLYYAPQDSAYFDPTYNEYLCAIGCFDLTASSGSGPAKPPSGNPAVTPTMPPSNDDEPTPPPSSDAAPAPPPGSSIVPPPPATLFRPPPPSMPIAPASIPVASQPTQPPTTTVTPAKPPSPTGATVPTPPSTGPGGAAQAPGPAPAQTGAASITSASILLVLASILISFLV